MLLFLTLKYFEFFKLIKVHRKRRIHDKSIHAPPQIEKLRYYGGRTF